jgi:hypothetical protein
MSASYTSKSPYFNTSISNGYLDILNLRDIPDNADDQVFSILPKYAYRPDLLAYDLYGDSSLWWVFAVRNKSVIQDSIYDFVPGTVIFLPQAASLKKALGV